MMPTKPVELLADALRRTNDVILRTFEDLPAEVYRWRPDGKGSSLGFIFWHIARWTDYFQASFIDADGSFESPPPPGAQVWERERLGELWGFGDARLGLHDTGTHADEQELEQLPWPSKEALIDYARRSFDAAAAAAGQISDDNFQQVQRSPRQSPETEPEGTIGSSLMSILAHNIHHLGEIHCLLGLRNTLQAAA